MEELYKLLEESLNEKLYQISVGGPRNKDGDIRLKLRPVMIKTEIYFQLESFRGNQVFHENLTAGEAAEKVGKALVSSFRQMDVETMDYQAVVLVSKKGKITIKKKSCARKEGRELSHNRAKKYILEEGRPVAFLKDLGVQTEDGQIIKSRYDKFRQINRFLEFIEDIMPILPKDRCVRIIDFGCGKSYLTFAMYYYLHELCGLDIRITGLDLKKEVIQNCRKLAEQYGYTGLEFMQGDIADYTGEEKVDMVVTLHACDTATDYALYKAICWDAGVILSVPCCQHEMNRQIQCEALRPALKYGLVKERMSALLTDALRGNLLEEAGYDTQLLEFISLEHTPKNILIRAVKREGGKPVDTGINKMADFLHVHTCLQELLERPENSQRAE